LPIPKPCCGSGAENFRERNRQHRLISPVRNLNVPTSAVVAFLVAFRNHVAGHRDGDIPRSLKVRVPVAFGIAHEVALCPDIEIVEIRFRLRLRGRWLTKVVA
jgi:hypothetical protein